MIGAHPETLFPPPSSPRRESETGELSVLDVSGGELEHIRFAARSERSSDTAGLEGAGVPRLFNILFGVSRAKSGAVYPDGGGLPRSATEAARRGVCLVPGDRKRNGLMLDQSVLFNISQVAVGAMRGGSPLYSKAEARIRALRQIAQLRIKTRSAETLVNHLSGGNQQKVVVGKWLEIAPKVILLDDPTRGASIGAKRELYDLIRAMSALGRIVLFRSTELPELIGLCDRILVLYRGRLVGMPGRDVDNRTLLHLINTEETPNQPAGAVA